MAISPTKFTFEQVKNHNKINDLWIVIENRVYDITNFHTEHPGGSEVLQEVAGKDATKKFQSIGHSESAAEQMKRYFVGEITDEDSEENRQWKCSDFVGCSVLGPIGVVGFALIQCCRWLTCRSSTT